MNVLVIGCHPDDIEIGCGGTVAKYSASGHSVTCCCVADGSMGHVQIAPAQLVGIRAEEARQSAGLLGAALVSLKIPDLEIDSKNPDIVRHMVTVIREVQPDVILTHSPDDYMLDHVEVSRLVYDASFSASIPQYAPEAGAACAVTPLYYMDTMAGVGFLPTEYVDISETIDLKLAALSCHTTQIKWMYQYDNVDFLEFVRTCARYRGFQCGASFAEGFRSREAWPRLRAGRILP